MLNKFFIILFISLTYYIFSDDTIKTPTLPDEPAVKSSEETNEKEIEYNIEYQNKKGTFQKGVITKQTGYYLKLQWEGNDEGNQELLVDFVKSIKIKGYAMQKKTNNNLGIVYYFPYIYDIELKDGKTIKNAKGRIEQLESFSIYNDLGRQKCYTYFIRYWLEDLMVFNDNNSSDYNEEPKIPDSVVVDIDFLE